MVARLYDPWLSRDFSKGCERLNKIGICLRRASKVERHSRRMGGGPGDPWGIMRRSIHGKAGLTKLECPRGFVLNLVEAGKSELCVRPQRRIARESLGKP